MRDWKGRSEAAAIPLRSSCLVVGSGRCRDTRGPSVRSAPSLPACLLALPAKGAPGRAVEIRAAVGRGAPTGTCPLHLPQEPLVLPLPCGLGVVMASCISLQAPLCAMTVPKAGAPKPSRPHLCASGLGLISVTSAFISVMPRTALRPGPRRLTSCPAS